MDVQGKTEKARAKALKAERAWQREQMLYERVLTPNVVRLLLLAGIIGYSTYVCRSKTNAGPVQSALAFALPGVGIPLLAAEAGITDKYALAAISGASVGYVTGQAAVGLSEAYGLNSFTPILAALPGGLPLALALEL